MRNRYLKHILTLTGLCIALIINAQNPVRFQNITVNDGLSMGTITSFAKDQQGYMWVATAEGLHRYDGQYFKIYKHVENDSNSLTDSYVTALYSYRNQLYIGNHTGSIDILNLDNGQFEQLEFKEQIPDFDYPILDLKIFNQQLIIATSGGGLWSYHLSKNTLSRYTSETTSQVFTSIVVNRDECYVSTDRSVYRISDDKLITLPIYTEAMITALAINENDLIIGTQRGLFKYELSSQEINAIALPEKKRLVYFITSIQTFDDQLWVGTKGGILQYQNGQVHLYTSNTIRPNSLVNNQVSCLFRSNDDILWVGTISGVSYYAPQLGKFGLLQYFDYEGVNYNNNVYYTYEDRDHTIWLGTLTSGLIQLNERHRISKVYPLLKDQGVESRAVRAMLEDSKGRFWIGTRDDALFQFDKTKGIFRFITHFSSGAGSNNAIRSIYEDRHGTIWFGTQIGLFYLNDNGDFIHCLAENKALNNSVYQITEHPTSDQLILGSFRGGIQIYDPKTGDFTSYKHHDNDSTSLSNNNVMSLEWFNNDTLLVGTYGGGMNLFDLRSHLFTHVSERHGLVNNAVYGILNEGNGYCWLSTNNGIVRYSIYDRTFVNFKPEHYLQSTEYNEGAFLRSSDGYFYFGGVNGLNYFKPEMIDYDQHAAPLLYTDIRGDFSRKDNNNIKLSFLNSRLEIDFMALHYANPLGVRYKYQMKGYDNNWVQDFTSNTAVYPRLSPGHYRFQVIAEDEFGQWRTVSDELNIFVEPPLYQKWWFITLAVLVILALLYILFRYRTREIERLYKLQLVDSELAALRSQMNPHFIFNSLNSIQYFILKREPKEAYTYLSKFASLMRKILQNSRLKFISVKDEVEWLNLYLEMEKMRMDNILEYDIRCENIDDQDDVFIPTMLIQPFVENSIIHGLLPKDEDRKLDVVIARDNEQIVCTVTDNGIGRVASREMNAQRSSKHASAGMDLTRKRLEILSEGRGHFDVQFEDLYDGDTAIGTAARIVFPVIKKID